MGTVIWFRDFYFFIRFFILFTANTVRETLNSLTVAKVDHSYSNSPAVYKEFNNLSNKAMIVTLQKKLTMVYR